jgi:hypothetical protein
MLEYDNQLYAANSRRIYCLFVQILLNMFQALQCPSSGARQTAVAASGFRMDVQVEVFSAVVGLLTNFWFPYGCAGGSVLSRGRFVNKPLVSVWMCRWKCSQPWSVC